MQLKQQEIIFQIFKNKEEIGMFAFYSRSNKISHLPSISKGSSFIGRNVGKFIDCNVPITRVKSTHRRMLGTTPLYSQINNKVISVYSPSPRNYSSMGKSFSPSRPQTETISNPQDPKAIIETAFSPRNPVFHPIFVPSKTKNLILKQIYQT